MAESKHYERTSGFGHTMAGETDGLRAQVMLLQELSQKLDEYFALR